MQEKAKDIARSKNDTATLLIVGQVLLAMQGRTGIEVQR